MSAAPVWPAGGPRSRGERLFAACILAYGQHDRLMGKRDSNIRAMSSAERVDLLSKIGEREPTTPEDRVAQGLAREVIAEVEAWETI